ncbi:MAG TPA: outer membrane beta-barrel protein [Pseudolabrys sp.]
MKKLLLASSALMMSGSVFAADLPGRMPVRAPIAAPVPFSWTGCYVGGHIGAGWGRTEYSEPGFGDIAPLGGGSIDLDHQASVVGGAQVGCDYQFASNWVIGVAGDFSWADIDGQATDPFFSGKFGNPITLHARTDELATVTGRLGYAWDRFMLYGKGGFAWSHNKYSLDNLGTFNGNLCSTGVFVACNPTGSEDRTGSTAGVGIEWAFLNNWSAMVEYDHYGFGTRSVTFVEPNGTPTTGHFDIKQDVDVVKVGLNYRFTGLLR